MSTAKVDSAGKVFPLDRRADAEEVVTEADVQEPRKLARMLARLLSNVAKLLRVWAPRRIYFQDFTCHGTVGVPVTVQMQHNFRGRVNWWVVDYVPVGDNYPLTAQDASKTTADTLGVYVFVDGRISFCVEEAG